MSYYLIQQIEKNANITVRTCTEVVDTLGEDDHITGLVLFNKRAARRKRWNAIGCAASSGRRARTNG